MGRRGLEITDIEGLWRFARMVFLSGFAPKGFPSIESIAVAIEAGLELGLPPLSSLQNIAVINGRPTLYGDLVKGVVMGSKVCEWIKESFEGNRYNDDFRAVCISQRRGAPEPHRTEFSVADARRAKLWGKEGPWTFYPDRMLMARARNFNLRDQFADVLKGFYSSDETEVVEAADLPPPAATRVEGLKAKLNTA